MLVDNHLHIEDRNNEEGHDFQDPKGYIESGLKRNVSMFGFSDHAYIFNEARDINFNGWQEERRKFFLKDYISVLEKQREKFPDLLIGLEIDYIPEKERQIERFISEINKAYNFDFFIGSVHWVGQWGFDLDSSEYEKVMRDRRKEKIHKEYFGIVKKAVESRLFNIIGHVDLIKIFSRSNDLERYSHDILSVLKEHDQTIEINTNGKNKPIGEFYPGRRFVKECCQLGIPITLGSDAHSPDRTGEGFDESLAILEEAGYEQISYFEKGERKSIKLHL